MNHKAFIVLLIFTSISIGQEIDSTKIKTPRNAALWSILPGGGQIYNGKYFKAGVIITLESLALMQSIKSGNSYDDNLSQDDLLDRNKFAWWAFFVHLYGTLDAVVDSHLEPFEPMMENDSLYFKTIEKEIQPNG